MGAVARILSATAPIYVTDNLSNLGSKFPYNVSPHKTIKANFCMQWKASA